MGTARRRLALLGLLVLVGCGPSARQEAPEEAISSEAASTPQRAAQPPGPVGGEQRLIRTAQLLVVVEDVERAMRQVESVASGLDGFLEESQVITDQAGSQRATVSLRIPTSAFQTALNELRQLGEVRRDRIASEDVTKAYIDLQTLLPWALVGLAIWLMARQIKKRRTAD